MVPVAPSTSETMTPPAPPVPGNRLGFSLITVHTFSLLVLLLPGTIEPCVHATGRWLLVGKSTYQARHSSMSHASTSFLPVEVWIPGIPLVSSQSAGSA